MKVDSVKVREAIEWAVYDASTFDGSFTAYGFTLAPMAREAIVPLTPENLHAVLSARCDIQTLYLGNGAERSQYNFVGGAQYRYVGGALESACEQAVEKVQSND